MGNTTSDLHTQTTGMSSALDSGMMSVLGKQAAKPYEPPKYDKSGVGLVRAKRGIDEGKTLRPWHRQLPLEKFFV